MKTLFRGSIFETNSSATHSMVILSKDKYEKWDKNGLYAREGEFDKLYTYDEAIAESNKYHWLDKYLEIGDTYKVNKALNNCGFYKYDDWFNDEFLETDSYSFKTEHGDEIVIDYKYGWDG